METVGQPPSSDVRPPRGPYTWSDFIALPDDDKRELIDGELVEVEVPTLLRERIQNLLAFFLTQWVLAHDAGNVLGAGYKVRISDRRGVMPDIQFYRAGNPSFGEEQGLTSGHPDLAVEIVSPSSERYDQVTKRNWYAQIGVPEYWVVSPQSRTIERLLLRSGRSVTEGIATDDDVFKPDTFPGLEIPLAKLWAVPAEPRH